MFFQYTHLPIIPIAWLFHSKCLFCCCCIIAVFTPAMPPISTNGTVVSAEFDGQTLFINQTTAVNHLMSIYHLRRFFIHFCCLVVAIAVAVGFPLHADQCVPIFFFHLFRRHGILLHTHQQQNLRCHDLLGQYYAVCQF